MIEDKFDSHDECCINSSVYRIINLAKKLLKTYVTLQNCLFYLHDYLTDLENNLIFSILQISNQEAEKFTAFIRNQNLRKTESIIECLERLDLENDFDNEYLNYIQFLTNGEKYKKEMESSELKEYIYFGHKYTRNDLLKINKENSLLTSHDFLTLRGIISLKSSISISTRATIHGIKHYGRGFHYSEKHYYTSNVNNCNSTNNNNIPTNDLNNLSKHWFNPKQNSSWCKVGSSVYGQLNYFFNLSSIVTDKFVSEIKIASITCRRAVIPNYMNNNVSPAITCINLKRSKNNNQTSWYKNDVSFVDIEAIFPTRVATIGLHKESNKVSYKPIDCNNVISDANQKKSGTIRLSKEIIIDYLALIDVSPENYADDESKLIEKIHNMNDS